MSPNGSVALSGGAWDESREHADRAGIDPRRPPGRRPDQRDPGQPVRPPGRRHPPLGKEEQDRTVLHPDYASWANPIEAHFGPLRQFTIANLHYPDHTVQTRAPHAYLRRRNADTRHPGVLAAARKERAPWDLTSAVGRHADAADMGSELREHAERGRVCVCPRG